jgi:hypothetical protein
MLTCSQTGTPDIQETAGLSFLTLPLSPHAAEETATSAAVIIVKVLGFTVVYFDLE